MPPPEEAKNADIADQIKAAEHAEKHKHPGRVPRTPGHKPVSTPRPGYSHRKPGMAALKGITADGDY